MTEPILASVIQNLCQYIEQNSASTLTLAHLARRSGFSPYHLQRSFRSLVGVSPRQFQQACRLQRLKTTLRAGAQATGAIFDAGYGSLSRVYESSAATLGMTPLEYSRGGRGLAISSAEFDTPFGPMMLGATARGLCFLQFGQDATALRATLHGEFPAATIEELAKPYPEQLEAWIAAIGAHLAGAQPLPHLPLHLRATAFQAMVWRYLQTIPRGETQSYAQVAAAIGQPKAARAVARACASNPVAIAIPCHRVIRGDGSPGGYRWGLNRKQALLAAEKTV